MSGPASGPGRIKVTGHRGAMGLALQNTAASLRAGEEAGVDEIEIDVRLTADDVPIIVHDAHLAAMVGDPGEQRILRELSWATVRDVTLSDGQRVLTLSDVLAQTTVGLQVEIKTPESVPVVAAVLAEHPQDGERCLITSFGQNILAEAQRLLPLVPRGWIRSTYEPDAPAVLERLGATWLFSGWSGLDAEAVELLHGRGVRVGGWPLRTREQAFLAVALGVDAVTTDDPRRARNWLAEAGR